MENVLENIYMNFSGKGNLHYVFFLKCLLVTFFHFGVGWTSSEIVERKGDERSVQYGYSVLASITFAFCLSNILLLFYSFTASSGFYFGTFLIAYRFITHTLIHACVPGFFLSSDNREKSIRALRTIYIWGVAFLAIGAVSAGIGMNLVGINLYLVVVFLILHTARIFRMLRNMEIVHMLMIYISLFTIITGANVVLIKGHDNIFDGGSEMSGSIVQLILELFRLNQNLDLHAFHGYNTAVGLVNTDPAFSVDNSLMNGIKNFTNEHLDKDMLGGVVGSFCISLFAFVINRISRLTREYKTGKS